MKVEVGIGIHRHMEVYGNRGPLKRPQIEIERFPYHMDPNKVPRISETPPYDPEPSNPLKFTPDLGFPTEATQARQPLPGAGLRTD